MTEDKFIRTYVINPGEPEVLAGLEDEFENEEKYFPYDLLVTLKLLDPSEMTSCWNKQTDEPSVYFENSRVGELYKLVPQSDLEGEDLSQYEMYPDRKGYYKIPTTIEEYFTISEKLDTFYITIAELLNIWSGSSVNVDLSLLEVKFIDAMVKKGMISQQKGEQLTDCIANRIENVLEQDKKDFRLLYIPNLNDNYSKDYSETVQNIDNERYDINGELTKKSNSLPFCSIVKIPKKKIKLNQRMADINIFQNLETLCKNHLFIKEDIEELKKYILNTKRYGIWLEIKTALGKLGGFKEINKGKK